jgi:hypothetical protein
MTQDQAVPLQHNTGIYLVHNTTKPTNPSAPSKGDEIPIPSRYHYNRAKPLYGIPEVGTHWWAIYYNHYKEKLSIIISTYNPCLLIITKKETFGVISMQIDNTLFLGSEEFTTLKDNEL